MSPIFSTAGTVATDVWYAVSRRQTVSRGLPTAFSTFAPIAYAGIGHNLPPATFDRSIPLLLQRAPGLVHYAGWDTAQAQAQTAPQGNQDAPGDASTSFARA